MTESDQKTIALPAPAEASPASEPEAGTEAEAAQEEIHTEDTPAADEIPDSDTAAPDETSDKRYTPSHILKKILIRSLAAVTVLVSGITGSFLLRGSVPADITPLLLGDLFGGPENIRAVSSAEVLPYDPAQPDDENPSGSLHPLDSIVHPTSPETLPADTLTLSNETPYDPDMNEILASERVIPPADELYAAYGEDAPLVLILHTHATESFSDTAADGYRSSDTSKNVVALGRAIAGRLEEHGIPVIHSTTLHDEEDFTLAYYKASLEIRETLEQYPSVSYILDVHRDSIESDGVYIAPSTDTPDGTAAQMMFVVGTDYGGSGHTTWRNNLALAARLQVSLNGATPALMRNMNLRSASFNEQYTDGSLLLEIGACGSTLDEAKRSALLFADAFAEEILGNS